MQNQCQGRGIVCSDFLEDSKRHWRTNRSVESYEGNDRNKISPVASGLSGGVGCCGSVT